MKQNTSDVKQFSS